MQPIYLLFACSYVRKIKKRPKPLPRSMWGWIPLVLRYSQDELLELAGYDAAMYLRILSFGMRDISPKGSPERVG